MTVEEKESSLEDGLESNTVHSAHEVVIEEVVVGDVVVGEREEVVGEEVVGERGVGVEVFGVVGEGVTMVIGVVTVGEGGLVFVTREHHLPHLRQIGRFFLVVEGVVIGGLVVVEVVVGGCDDWDD